jgi:hypothetical protein
MKAVGAGAVAGGINWARSGGNDGSLQYAFQLLRLGLRSIL